MMSRFIAFLRALNTGPNRNVKMAALRQVFESLEFSRVDTAFVSGNVVFDTDNVDRWALQKMIEDRLRATFGYKIAIFIRASVELAAIAAYRPFSQWLITSAAEYNIILLSEAPEKESLNKLLALADKENEFHVHRSEVYWLRQTRPEEATFSPVPLVKAHNKPFTIRTTKIIARIAQKYCP